MASTITGIDSPGIEPDPQPEEPGLIGGRAETWALPHTDDELFEPTIVRGRE